MPNWEDVIIYLDKNSGIHTYGRVAKAIRSHARAVGAMMRAIHNRKRHAYCPRVVDGTTARPAFLCRG